MQTISRNVIISPPQDRPNPNELENLRGRSGTRQQKLAGGEFSQPTHALTYPPPEK